MTTRPDHPPVITTTGTTDGTGTTRRPAALVALVAALTAGLLLTLGAAPAQAAGYRYWSFWKWSGTGWAYQQQGPAVYVPPDGSVDGWRFAVSPDGGQDAARPGTPGDFATACAGTPGQAGRKRVAVVLDFGTAADAASGETPPEPRTACAAVPTSASSAEVLAAVVPPLRYDTNGMLCAIAGYPKAGCGEQLGAAHQPSGGGGSGGGSGGGGTGGSGPELGLIAGGALVAALAAGAVRQARRRR
ncbi:SCO2322 family protein [Kitasatospora sp. NPDC087315]|uniref:SCO2322 family protein n=1 Tax=Kitasatospora sp. NPDC087315 TaxID=3364069 RepID=UPI0037F919FA